MDDQAKNDFKSLIQELIPEFITNLKQIMNASIEIELVDFVDAKVSAEAYKVEDKSMSVFANFANAELGSLVFYAPLQAAAIVADLMSGGTGAAEVEEFKSVQQAAFSEAISQPIKAIIHKLSSMNPGLELGLSEFENQLLDPGAEDSLKCSIPEAAYLGLNLKVKLNASEGEEYNCFLDLSEVLIQSLTGGQAAAMVGADRNQVSDVSFANMQSTADPNDIHEKRNMNLLMDIKLGLIVELGRAEMTLRDILKLTKGSVIELDRLSGEPVDLFVNNKIIARGEVVVIDDSFGLRITQLAGNVDLAADMGIGINV